MMECGGEGSGAKIGGKRTTFQDFQHASGTGKGVSGIRHVLINDGKSGNGSVFWPQAKSSIVAKIHVGHCL